VQQVGRALYENNKLFGFRTTLLYRPDLIRWRLVNQFGKMLGVDIRSVLSTRMINQFPVEYADGTGVRELLRIVSSRLDRSGLLTDRLWEWSELAFDRWVARQLQKGLDAVYGYEHASLETFRRAKELGIPRIYEVPAPDPLYVDRIYAKEIEDFPQLGTRYQARLRSRLQARTRRRREEWGLADLVIANSELTRDSYLSAGLDVKKVRVIPLASPPVTSMKLHTERQGPVRFVWAGTFGIRKGAHYLLESWKQLGVLQGSATIDVYGKVELPGKLLEQMPRGVVLHGPVPQVELFRHFLNSDMLVFPTLCDGFGMVVTEAMAHGLPVLTTPAAGASQLIVDGTNGFVVAAGSSDSLARKLRYCIENRSRLASMSEAAIESARCNQWADFRRSVVGVIDEFLESWEKR